MFRNTAAIVLVIALAGIPATSVPAAGETAAMQADPIRTLVERLDLQRYKATIKGLTQFGDRRQGTDRNRAAVDWIATQLKSYGCLPERIQYVYDPPPPATGGGRGRGTSALASGGGRPRGVRAPTGLNTDPMKQPDLKLRELNMPPMAPGPRDEVLCTKAG